MRYARAQRFLVSIDCVFKVVEIAKACNQRQKSVTKAENGSRDLFAAIYIQDKGPIEGDAVVTNVLDRSFDVYMPSMAYEVRHCYPVVCGVCLLTVWLQGRIRLDSLPVKQSNYKSKSLYCCLLV